MLGKTPSKISQFAHSVLQPFTTLPIKPYFDYPINTCLLEQTIEVNCNALFANGTGAVPSGYGIAISIFPHSFQDRLDQSSIIGQPACNIRLITQYNNGGGQPGDVAQNQASPLAGYWGLNNNVSARWTSARVVRCGVRLIPISAQISRAGLIQIVQIPGRDTELNVSPTSGIIVPFPNTTQIKTYSTSYEASNASTQVKHAYAWVPTDVMDAIFVQDKIQCTNGAGYIIDVQSDMDAYANKLRNGIYILGSGLAQTDAFRLEVKICYEFVPTTTYKQWADTNGPRSSLADQQVLKDIVIGSPDAQSIQEDSWGDWLFAAGQNMGSAASGFAQGIYQQAVQDGNMYANAIRY